MKRNAILSMLIGFVAIFFMSCGGDDPIIATGISMDQDSLSVAVESTGILVASLDPEGAEGTIVWSSSDPSVAAVNNGVVTGLKVGTATVVAAAGVFSVSCEVSVVPKELDPDDLPASLKGSNYHIMQIDEVSYEFIKEKIDNDFRPDEEVGSKNLWIWESTFVAGTASGLNYYGQAQGWLSLVVSSVGWSGAGYNVGTGYGDIDMTDLYANPDDYVFHVGLKSSQASTAYLFIFTDGITEAKVCVGGSAIEGIAPYKDFARDNEWQTVEIPVSYLNSLGLFYNATFTDVNILAFLAGGVQGTMLDMDAAFFYKTAE